MPRKASIEKQLEKAAMSALDYMGTMGSSVEIYLVPDEIIHEINLNYRGKDKPTNVLSFEVPSEEMPSPETELTHLGEIYLAPQYIREHNDNIGDLMIHGLLHLLKFDHIKDEDADIMEAKEQELKTYLREKELI